MVGVEANVAILIVAQLLQRRLLQPAGRVRLRSGAARGFDDGLCAERLSRRRLLRRPVAGAVRARHEAERDRQRDHPAGAPSTSVQRRRAFPPILARRIAHALAMHCDARRVRKIC